MPKPRAAHGSPTLTEFLLTRIAAVEERVSGGAQGTQTSYYGWHTVDCGVGLGYRADEECVCRYVDRVLSECEAKRRIVEEHSSMPADYLHLPNECRVCAEANPCLTLRHLASVYADHPDYRVEWRP